MKMELRELSVEVQVKLAEFAWQASKEAVAGQPRAAAISLFVENFTEALDGFVRACEAAGKPKA